MGQASGNRSVNTYNSPHHKNGSSGTMGQQGSKIGPVISEDVLREPNLQQHSKCSSKQDTDKLKINETSNFWENYGINPSEKLQHVREEDWAQDLSNIWNDSSPIPEANIKRKTLSLNKKDDILTKESLTILGSDKALNNGNNIDIKNALEKNVKYTKRNQQEINNNVEVNSGKEIVKNVKEFTQDNNKSTGESSNNLGSNGKRKYTNTDTKLKDSKNTNTFSTVKEINSKRKRLMCRNHTEKKIRTIHRKRTSGISRNVSNSFPNKKDNRNKDEEQNAQKLSNEYENTQNQIELSDKQSINIKSSKKYKVIEMENSNYVHLGDRYVVNAVTVINGEPFIVSNSNVVQVNTDNTNPFTVASFKITKQIFSGIKLLLMLLLIVLGVSLLVSIVRYKNLCSCQNVSCIQCIAYFLNDSIYVGPGGLDYYYLPNSNNMLNNHHQNNYTFSERLLI